MIKRKHTDYEHGHDDSCSCCSDSYFNMLCEQDPELEEKSRVANELIKERMLEIRIEREKNSRE